MRFRHKIASSSVKQHVHRYAKLSLLVAAATLGGALFAYVGSPLPWMIGPLVVTALLTITGVTSVRVPDRLRPFGQIVVATQVGLTFTAAAFARMIEYAPVILSMALLTLTCVLLLSVAMSRLTGMTLAQSFLASIPSSPVEAASMSVGFRIDPVPVVLMQTLRLSFVVLILPLGIFAIDGWPTDRTRPQMSGSFDITQTLLLLALGFAAMKLFRWLKVANPNFLGPLTLSALLTILGLQLGPLPPLIMAAAQIVLGCWLGATFRRDLLGTAGRLTLIALASTLALLALCSLSGVAVAYVTGMDWRLLVLGAAPGGVVEMVLTAKFLNQDATLVTVFHLARIFLLMPTIPWFVLLLMRLERRRSS